MKRKGIFLLTLIFLLSPVFMALAQNESSQKVPIGMEEIQIGGSAKFIIPKGAKTHKVGAQLIVEGTKEYMSRRFFEMEERFALIEKTQNDILKAIEELRQAVDGLNKGALENQKEVVKLQEQAQDLQKQIEMVTFEVRQTGAGDTPKNP